MTQEQKEWVNNFTTRLQSAVEQLESDGNTDDAQQLALHGGFVHGLLLKLDEELEKYKEREDLAVQSFAQSIGQALGAKEQPAVTRSEIPF